MEVEKLYKPIAMSCLAVLVVWAWRIYNWAWLTPKKLEKRLREQGFKGNPYTLLVGDLQESDQLLKEALLKPVDIDDYNGPARVHPMVVRTTQKYGKKNFIWIGRMPRVTVYNLEHIKEVVTNHTTFQKHFPVQHPLTRLLFVGLGALEGDEYVKHRKIIYPAFRHEKLKDMVTVFEEAYIELGNKWKKTMAATSSTEIDVFPLFGIASGDSISRVAFGSNYTEGSKTFELLKEVIDLTMDLRNKPYIPGSSYLPTKMNMRIRKLHKEIDERLGAMVNRRMNEMKAVGNPTHYYCDLLGLLLESNMQTSIQQGNNNSGLTIQEIVNECKLFYFAAKDTIATLLTWTLVMLSRHPKWQDRAREEVLRELGKKKLDYDSLSRLKIVTAIVYEVLRLFPLIPDLFKVAVKDTKLGDLSIPAGVGVFVPVIELHWEKEIYGEDADKFNPARFLEGVGSATKGQILSFMAFSYGARSCPGQFFALLQAKTALSSILRRFSFELSPSYMHAPVPLLNLEPKYGAQIILHQLPED